MRVNDYLRRVSKRETVIVMTDAVLSAPEQTPTEAYAVNLLNRLAQHGYVLVRKDRVRG